MNRNYQRGRNAEYETRDTLTRLGFSCIRAASSHGIFDVVGVRSDAVVLIQCKQGGHPSPNEYKSLVDLPTPPGVLRLLLWFPPGREKPRILWHSGERLPEWVRLTEWQEGMPPKQQAMRFPKGKNSEESKHKAAI